MRAAVVVVAVLVVTVAAARAGSIEGRVLPGQKVAVDTVPPTAARITYADREGWFTIGQLDPGLYTITTVEGHTTTITRLHVSAHETTAVATDVDHVDLANLRSDDTVETAIRLAPSSRNDGYGYAIAGSTSLEHRYRLDGMDVTGPTLGTLDVRLPLAFVDNVDVIEAGAGPTHGRATGAFVDVTSRHGGTELAGSLFGTWWPGQLAGTAKQTSAASQAISVSSKQTYATQFGGTLAGPLVNDHVWLFVGFAPSLSSVDYTRTIRGQVDRDQNGAADLDGRGAPITEVVDTTVSAAPSRGGAAIARLDMVFDSHNAASMTAYTDTLATTTPPTFGASTTGTRSTSAVEMASGRWSAHYGAVELDAHVGWVRLEHDLGASDPDAAHLPLRLVDPSTVDLGIARCRDGGRDDPYPLITNCPLSLWYATGGPGVISHDVQQRLAADVGVRDRLGAHALEAGLDGEDATRQNAVRYSGGILYGDGITQQFVRVGNYPSSCRDGGIVRGCEFLDDNLDDTTNTRSLAWGAHARDVWRPSSDLLIDVGVRYDQQHLDGIPRIHDVAPRLGVAYDPSHTGNARLFAHWGRYFDQLPLSLAGHAGGDVEGYVQFGTSGLVQYSGGLGIPATMRAAYVDELAFGVERALGGLDVAATFIDRRLHQVMEDAPDATGTLAITDLEAGSHDPPVRVFDAVELAASKRWDGLYLRASYTFSKLTGNYSGRISYDNAQLDPYTSTDYDLIELTANRSGFLPQDRTHAIKLDASYELPIGRRRSLTIGTRLRTLSGEPEPVLGSSFLIGNNEVELLPRGTLGRGRFTNTIDLHALYRQRLSRSRAFELYADVLNVLDDQTAFSVDSAYTIEPSSVLPISGGSYSDLVWLKEIPPLGRARPAIRNPNFRQPTATYAPISTRCGFRFLF